jgi:hypothetical protein
MAHHVIPDLQDVPNGQRKGGLRKQGHLQSEANNMGIQYGHICIRRQSRCFVKHSELAWPHLHAVPTQCDVWNIPLGRETLGMK